jgi:hypothetical protein
MPSTFLTPEVSNAISDEVGLQKPQCGWSAEIVRLFEFAHRGDALAVASIAYRMKRSAAQEGLDAIAQAAARIEASARRNQTLEYVSEIQLLDHQMRWLAR